MKVAIILNRSHPAARTMAKKALSIGYDVASGRLSGAGRLLLPEYDSFAHLLDGDPVFLGLDETLPMAKIAECDLLIWEWGWSSGPPARLLEIREKLDIPTLVFPGPLDLFWREVSPGDIGLHCEAAAATDAAGVMLEDMVPYYRSLLPHASVFHLPVPVDVNAIAAMALPVKDREPNLAFLTAPTRFTGGASQMATSTMLAFRQACEEKQRLRGLAYVYSSEEELESNLILRRLGLSTTVQVRNYVRPLQRFIEQLRICSAGILLTSAHIQGRNAMIAACLGVPLVVSEQIETHRRLFPHTTVRWYETERASQFFIRLLDDPDFYGEVVRTAREAVDYYAPMRVREMLVRGIGGINGGKH